MDAVSISFTIAFVAGIASFLSPCVLPLVPLYLAQLIGQSVTPATQKQEERPSQVTTFLHALMFVLGFTIAFVALGATASTLGSFLREYQVLLRQGGGIILVIFGLHLAGVLKWSWLSQQKQWHLRPARPGYATSMLVGLIFALGWTPCAGPILGSILTLAANSFTLQQGVLLLLCYSLGLGLPFLLLGLGLSPFRNMLGRLKPHLRKIEIATGLMMISAGFLIFFNLLPFFNQYFQ